MVKPPFSNNYNPTHSKMGKKGEKREARVERKQ
jgi:hypothetical protein